MKRETYRSPLNISYAWDISHALATLYHPYTTNPSALTEYLKHKLQAQRAKRRSRSHPAQVESNVPLERNNDPHFNIYAKGDIINDDETWLQLKKYLRNRNYKTMLIGTGSATEDFVCNICHGHDHPGGLCPFPRIPGWNVGYNTRKPNYTNTQQQTQLPPSSANSTSNNYGYRNANNRPLANTFSGRERGLAPPNRGRPRPY